MGMQSIEVWLDSVSDPTQPVFCVSLCRVSDHSEIKCLSVHGKLDAAKRAGIDAAAVRGVAAFLRFPSGELERIV